MWYVNKGLHFDSLNLQDSFNLVLFCRFHVKKCHVEIHSWCCAWLCKFTRTWCWLRVFICLQHVLVTPGFNGLGKDNCKTRRETFRLWDLVHLTLEVWRYWPCYNDTTLYSLLSSEPHSQPHMQWFNGLPPGLLHVLEHIGLFYMGRSRVGASTQILSTSTSTLLSMSTSTSTEKNVWVWVQVRVL